ncbi:MAG TPA: carboxypeptidase-like regulatory domain-containing protein, partial [Terracidiphilus sp.]|nr:carboxypeptidase-like regulatory domain-containing protein [Terracidiphilus sp.]
MKTLREILLTGTAVLAMAVAAPVIAQNTATVHGTVTNPAGQPFGNITVKFTKDKSTPYKDEKFVNTFTTDASGAFKGTGVAPGDYFVYFTQGDKMLDRLEVTIKADQADVTINDDMSRPEYLKSLTPEERKAIEDYKKNNAAAAESNKKIANLNATLQAVRADLKAAAPTHGDVSKDVTDMKSAVDAKPDESILWIEYGDALIGQGDHMATSDKAEASKDYDAAIDAYKKGAELDAASKKPNPIDQAAAWNGAGNAYSKEGKPTDASAAFENAVKAQPANAGMFYSNESIVLYRAGQADAAAAAADKAIAADPNRPEPYFIKGQALISKATVDPKTQKIIAPPGCVDAYQKYLQLAPTGPQAEEVKQILAGMGEKIDTKYNARKK